MTANRIFISDGAENVQVSQTAGQWRGHGGGARAHFTSF